MRVIQFVKRVNNTELGKGGTNETYILVPQEVNVDDIFEKKDAEINFEDKDTGTTEKIRLTKDREQRIVGLGPFYRRNKVSAGDSVIIERRIDNLNVSHFYISLQKYDNNIVLQKTKEGFEVLEEYKTNLFTKNIKIFKDGTLKTISLDFLKMIRKNIKSPNETKVYEVYIDGDGISDTYKKNNMLEIIVVDDIAHIRKIRTWEKYITEVKE